MGEKEAPTKKQSKKGQDATFVPQRSRVQLLAVLGLSTAIIFVVTRFLGIPVPHGWLNLGDSAIAASTLLMMHPLVAVAAGVGSALSNITSPAIIFAPATLLIKGTMGFVMYYFAKKGKFNLYAVGIFLAETIMVVGYTVYIFSLLTAGALPSDGYPAAIAAASTLPANLFQAAANFALALLLYYPLVRLRQALWGSPAMQTADTAKD